MSLIKSCIESRWDVGKLVEIDYKQLEVFALAFLSGDKKLKEDLINGVDVHSENAAKLFNIPFRIFLIRLAGNDPTTVKQRKLAKQMSFQLQYGAGAASMAATNNVTVATAKRFINNYFDRYPEVKLYHDKLIQEVKANREPSDKKSASGHPLGVSTIRSITGRLYTFYEEESPYGISFSPTAIKNFPVQGFATADIVPMMLGELFDFIYKNELQHNIKLVNTVHDSVLLDIQNDNICHTYLPQIKEVMESAPQVLKHKFGIDFDLPLNVDIKWGKTWSDMKTYEQRN